MWSRDRRGPRGIAGGPTSPRVLRAPADVDPRIDPRAVRPGPGPGSASGKAGLDLLRTVLSSGRDAVLACSGGGWALASAAEPGSDWPRVSGVGEADLVDGDEPPAIAEGADAAGRSRPSRRRRPRCRPAWPAHWPASMVFQANCVGIVDVVDEVAVDWGADLLEAVDHEVDPPALARGQVMDVRRRLMVKVLDRRTPRSRFGGRPAVGDPGRERLDLAAARPATRRAFGRPLAEGVAGDEPAVVARAVEATRTRPPRGRRRFRRRAKASGVARPHLGADLAADLPPTRPAWGPNVAGGVEEGQGVPRAGEHAVEGVIILGRNRVELVVVAAGAGDGEAEEGLAQHVDLAVELRRAVFA